MKYKQNWEETKEKFRNYWKHQNTGRPLMIVVAEKEGAAPLPEELRSKDMEDKYMNPERRSQAIGTGAKIMSFWEKVSRI